MGGLDDQIAGLGDGRLFLVTLAVAVLLGVRHATDPDHLTALSTLVLGGDEHGPGRARRMGLAWGAGHALALIAFGVPIVLFHGYLPEFVQQGAEAAVGVMIVALAVRLLRRWRRGELTSSPTSGMPGRTRRQAFGIGLLHGTGGSAGVGVLLLAAIPDHPTAIAALVLFAGCTAASMAGLTSLFGYVLVRGPVAGRVTAAVPVLGALSLSFGAWYLLVALQLAPSLS